jgi:hypothetical protein
MTSSAIKCCGVYMEPHVLTDKNQVPTEEVILSHIGQSKSCWESIFKYIHEDHPDFAEQWKFYRDGNCWLLKVTRKSKTIFWLSIIRDAFRITFYFGDKAEPAIMDSAMSGKLKDEFLNGKRYGKVRGITLTIKNNRDIEYVKSLITVKLGIK